MFIIRAFWGLFGGLGLIFLVYAMYLGDGTQKALGQLDKNEDYGRTILCIAYGRSESSMDVDMNFCKSIFAENKVFKDDIHPDDYGYMPGLKKEEKDNIRRLYVAISADDPGFKKRVPDFDKWWGQLPLKKH